MALNDLNQKYTIEKYCSRLDVSRALGTNLIDPIWRDIVDFRKKLQVELPIFDTTHIKFCVTYIDPVQGKTAQVNSQITSYVAAFSKLNPNSLDIYTYKRDMIKQCLKNVANYNKIDASEIILTNIIDGKPVSEEYSVLVRYFNALVDIKNESLVNIDEEFLANNYAKLRAEDELTSFYRTSDLESSASKFIIARDYDNGIPSHHIEEMMSVLLELVNSTSVSIVTRISAIFFMFNYIKPFDEYNMELACLLAKRVLASTSMNVSSIYLPIEFFLNEKVFYEDISKEVKKTHDFTYAFIKGAEILNVAFSVVLDRLTIIQTSTIDEEVKLGGNEKQVKEEFGIEIEKPVVVQPKKVETKAQMQQRLERKAQPDEVVSEKELKARAKELMEINPFLKKGQADFYVHHCTPGRFYTIQQYVKFEGCVYETARTSMDLLAKHGYYKREQIKNKFVYTPINKE